MSAWIVENEHLDLILTGRRHYRLHGGGLDDTSLTELGKQLQEENLKSIRYRYSDSEDMVAEADSVEPYQFEVFPYDFTAYDLVKALNSYTYQSCEHPGWASSYCKAWADGVIEHMVTRHGVVIDSQEYEDSDAWAISGGMIWGDDVIDYRS